MLPIKIFKLMLVFLSVAPERIYIITVSPHEKFGSRVVMVVNC